MKNLKCAVLLCSSLSFVAACDEEVPDNGIPDNQCAVIPGLPDSGEFYVVCPDGSMRLLETVQDGDDGQSCTVTENGDGTSRLSCPDGSSSTFSNGNADPGGGCLGLQRLDPTLGYCVPWYEVLFSGTISAADTSELPSALQPMTTTTCSGRIALPTGLSPASYGSAEEGFTGAYVFGHNPLYGIEMTVDNVTYQRDGRFSVPDTATYNTRYEGTSDSSGALWISSRTLGLKGFSPLAYTSLNFSSNQSIVAQQSFTMGLPTSLSDWNAMDSTRIVMNYDDYRGPNPQTAYISCDVTQFTVPY